MLPPRTLLVTLYRVYEHSGFTLAGAVAFSFIVSLFPFTIFLGALAGLFGGRDLAQAAITQLFQTLPGRVAEGLSPQVEAVLGNSRLDLLTVGGAIALFFATSAIETLRAALNGAYRVRENRPYPVCLAVSMTFVLVSAISMLALTWIVLVGPQLALRFEPLSVQTILAAGWVGAGLRYGLAAFVLGAQLFAMHVWLAAGRRTWAETLPGVALSVTCWLVVAGLYSYYLDLNDYTRFYAGLSQIMIAMLFFQLTAIIIIMGAELNRGLIEIGRAIEAHGNGTATAGE